MLGIFANFGHVGEVAHHRDARTLVRADTGAIHLECIDFARGAVRQLDWLIVASPNGLSNSGRAYHALSAATPSDASSKHHDFASCATERSGMPRRSWECRRFAPPLVVKATPMPHVAST